MQPEGSTTECPTCESTGSYQLAVFDDKNLPPTQEQKMAILIPIAVQGTEMYSFWLSYRSPLTGVQEGLSILFSEFRLGGIYGGTYDSHRYFASGDSLTDKNPAFVLPNTCYHVFPSAYMKDRNYLAAIDVQPVVCVGNIISGVSIDVTVHFIDPASPPEPTVVNHISMAINCSDAAAPIDYTLDANSLYSIEVMGTGANGDVTLDICTSSNAVSDTSVSAFFYDQLPLAALAYNSPPAYGSFQSVNAKALECCTPGSTVSIPGAKVVRIQQNREEFLHLNEIQIFDELGNNVALNGRCFSYTTGYSGNPDCLNDNEMGTHPETCNSHSSGSYTAPHKNYDYCVLSEVANITSITVHPWNDPTRTWMTDRIDNLSLSVFADVR